MVDVWCDGCLILLMVWWMSVVVNVWSGEYLVWWMSVVVNVLFFAMVWWMPGVVAVCVVDVVQSLEV